MTHAQEMAEARKLARTAKVREEKEYHNARLAGDMDLYACMIVRPAHISTKRNIKTDRNRIG